MCITSIFLKTYKYEFSDGFHQPLLRMVLQFYFGRTYGMATLSNKQRLS